MLDEIFSEIFDDDTIAKGYEYCINNKVEVTDEIENTIELKIDNKYDVSVELKEDSVPEMKCTCEKAVNGERCEHMAAAISFLMIDGDINDNYLELEDNTSDIANFIDNSSESEVKFFLSMLMSQDLDLFNEFKEFVNINRQIADEYQLNVEDTNPEEHNHEGCGCGCGYCD